MTGCASDKVLSLLPAALLGLQRPQNGMMWNDCVFFRMVNYEASKSQWNYLWQEISEAIQPWQLMHHSQHWLEMVWMCSHPSPRPPSEAQIHLAVLEPDHPGSQCSDGLPGLHKNNKNMIWIDSHWFSKKWSCMTPHMASSDSATAAITHHAHMITSMHK